jgi:host factor-I protein
LLYALAGGSVEKTGSQNIQDAFLNTLRREKAVVTIQMLHGTALSGRLKSFDKFSVLLDANGQDFLIFKHAIATVTHNSPRRPYGEGEPRGEQRGGERSGGSEQRQGSSAPPQQFNRRPNE